MVARVNAIYSEEIVGADAWSFITVDGFPMFPGSPAGVPTLSPNLEARVKPRIAGGLSMTEKARIVGGDLKISIPIKRNASPDLAAMLQNRRTSDRNVGYKLLRRFRTTSTDVPAYTTGLAGFTIVADSDAELYSINDENGNMTAFTRVDAPGPPSAGEFQVLTAGALTLEATDVDTTNGSYFQAEYIIPASSKRGIDNTELGELSIEGILITDRTPNPRGIAFSAPNCFLDPTSSPAIEEGDTANLVFSITSPEGDCNRGVVMLWLPETELIATSC